MDGLKIVWTKTALKQRESIFDYWNKRNGSNTYSKKLNLAIKQRLSILKTQTKIGKQSVVNDVFSISMHHYSIFYKKSDKTIFIIAFWDNRQSPEKLLSYLKEN